MSGSLSYSPQFLDSIAHPNLLDPAQATIDGNKAAASVWANRLSQAQQAAGQAQLAGVRPDGSFDPAAAALAMGPNTALAAGPTLESNQAIAGRQQEQALKNLTTQSAALDSLGPTATYQQVQAKIQEGLDGHWLQPSEANSVLTGMPQGNDPQSVATRGHMIQVMGDQVRSASERLQSQYGVKSTQTGPNGQTIGLSTDQRTGAVSTPQQPGAPLGPTPDTVAGLPPKVVPDTRPGAPPGAVTPVPRTYADVPSGSSPPTPIPGNGGYVVGPTAGYKPRGGAPSTAAPAPPTAAPQPAVAPPTGAAPQPQTYLAPPQNQNFNIENDQKIAAAASAASNDQQKRGIAGESALQALQLARTGPGTGAESQWIAFMEAHGVSIPAQGGLSSTDYRLLLQKNLLRFAQGQGTAAGTDLQLTAKLESNPNVQEMTNPANEHVLVQDLGILRRDQAMTRTMPQPSADGAVANHVKTFPGNTDPRAFAIDLMPPSDRAALLQEAAKQGPNGKIYQSLKIAHDNGHIGLPGQ